jgi:hypothetical protein
MKDHTTMRTTNETYSPRLEEGPRTTNLVLRMHRSELRALEELGQRYGEAKGTPPLGKTALIRLGIKRLMKSYPASKQQA